jgi:hypothetical protein
LFLQDKCVQGVAGSGGTTEPRAFVVAWDDRSAIFTHYGSFVNQSDIKILIKDMVALEAMLDCCINPLSVCNLLGSEGIHFLLFAAIGKHMV